MESSGHATSTLQPAVVGNEEEPTYRTLCVLALVSLGLGLLAPLCLVAPLLLAIPLFGFAVAAIALRQIAASDGAMIGRTAALVGMALCIGSAGAAMTRSYTSERLLSAQARDVATEWFTRLQTGDAEGAFRMTQESMRPVTPPAPGEPAGPTPNSFDLFRQRPVVEYLLSHGDHAKVSFDGALGTGGGPLSQYRLEQQYLVTDPEHGGEPITVRIVLQRTRIDGRLRWIVADYASDDLAAPAADHSHHHHHGHAH
jgi:hypothetical protein